MITRRRFATGALAASFAAAARSARAAPDMAAYRALNARATEAHVVPRYRAFAAAGAALRDALAALAAAPADGAALTAARTAFGSAMRAWQGIQHVRFGPIELFSRHQRIQLWPDPRNAIGRALAQALAARAPEPLAPRANALSQVAVQGLPALERLLFEPDAAAKLAAGDADAAYRAALVRAIGVNLATIGAAVVAGWTEGGDAYAVTLASARPPYVKAQEATIELFKALHGAVEIVADRKLTRALGTAPRDARPRLLESWRSALSGQNVQANLEAAHDMYRAGFAQALEATGEREVAALLARGFDRTVAGAGALPPPIEDAIADPARREPIAQLLREAAALKALLAQRLSAALDIPLGFSALDGD